MAFLRVGRNLRTMRERSAVARLVLRGFRWIRSLNCFRSRDWNKHLLNGATGNCSGSPYRDRVMAYSQPLSDGGLK